jgi:hypothetical protein
MVSYGFECRGWSAEKKEELAEALAKLLRPYSEMKPCPTVEIDGLYPGVWMRKLTHLPECDLDDIIVAADAVYDKVKGADE